MTRAALFQAFLGGVCGALTVVAIVHGDAVAAGLDAACSVSNVFLAIGNARKATNAGEF